MTLSWRNDPEKSPTSRDRKRARALRRQPTDAERKLWWHLRHRMPTNGTHFRRQVPIGPYVTDFCCLKAKLIVEVDGNQHGYDKHIGYDAHRTAYLMSQGFKVLRLTNREVLTAIDSALEFILAEIGTTTPTPNPSPQGGGEQAGA